MDLLAAGICRINEENWKGKRYLFMGVRMANPVQHMDMLRYEARGTVNSRWSMAAFFGFAVAAANVFIVVAGLYWINTLDEQYDRKMGWFVGLILETVPVVGFSLFAIGRLLQSRGALRGLLPAAIGVFLATIAGLAVMVNGAGDVLRSMRL